MIKLSTEGKPYSHNETRAFDAMPKDGGPISTTELVKKIYTRKRGKPTHSRQVVLAAMIALANKVKKNREPFIIKRTARAGPYPVQWRIEAK